MMMHSAATIREAPDHSGAATDFTIQALKRVIRADIINKAQALSALKDSSRVSGRYGSITDADIKAAEEEDAAPLLPEGYAANEQQPEQSGQIQ